VVFECITLLLKYHLMLTLYGISLPYRIGTKVTIKNYNTFLRNYGSSGYKFRFELNSDNCTGEVYIISMASTVHEDVVSRLQEVFKVPNNGVVDDPLILVSGQIRKRIYPTLPLVIEISKILIVFSYSTQGSQWNRG